MARRSHLSPFVAAYAKLATCVMELTIGKDPDKGKPGDAEPAEHSYGWKPMWLTFTGGGSKYFVLHLTGLTSEELNAFEAVTTVAIAAAREVVEDLDRQALEVLDDPNAEEIPQRALASAPPTFFKVRDARYKPEVLPEASGEPLL